MQLASRASSAHAAYIPKEGLQVGVRNTGRNGRVVGAVPSQAAS